MQSEFLKNPSYILKFTNKKSMTSSNFYREAPQPIIDRAHPKKHAIQINWIYLEPEKIKPTHTLNYWVIIIFEVEVWSDCSGELFNGERFNVVVPSLPMKVACDVQNYSCL